MAKRIEKCMIEVLNPGSFENLATMRYLQIHSLPKDYPGNYPFDLSVPNMLCNYKLK
jgi:hypothetical protein